MRSINSSLLKSVSKSATIGVVALLLVAGFFYWLVNREIEVRVAHVQRDVEIRVFGIGTIEAQILSKLSFQISGKLSAIEADQGDAVKAGTVLARLDDAAQQAKVRKSEIALRQAAALFAKADAQRERALATYNQKTAINQRRQSLIARGSVSQEAADDAQTSEDIARNELRVAEADLEIARVQQEDAAAQIRVDGVTLSQHALYAPFDARIISRHKELGSVATAGEPVLTIVAPDTIWVRTFIDESLAGDLSIGQTALVKLRSEPGKEFEAQIVRIDQENDRATEERRVYVRCRNCGVAHQFRYLGEQAEVQIIKRTIPSARLLPLKSVEAFDGQSGIVWTIDGGRLVKRKIRLGERTLDGQVEVSASLPNTIEVVADNNPGLREGRAARAAPAKEPR